MRKIFFLLSFVICTFMVKASGPWFSGMNLVHELVTKVTDADGNGLKTIDGRDPIDPLYKDDGTRITDSYTDADDDMSDGWGNANWKFEGIGWITGVSLNWEPTNQGNFWGLQSVNWKNFGYIQKAGQPIIWQQYDTFDPNYSQWSGAYKDAVQDNDMEFLVSLDFSGNKFNHFELDGGHISPVTLIDFSNNPTLDTLVILNCDNLQELNITNNGFSLSKIYEIAQFLDDPSVLKYAPQGEIKYSFPTNAVDLSKDVMLGNTASTIAWTGAQPVSEENGVFVFDPSLAGTTITANLSNKMIGSESITYTINLTSAEGSGINTLASASVQKVWSAGNLLFVTSNTTEIMRIYTIDGRLVKQQNVSQGTFSVALDKNLYIINFDNGANYKVLVK